MADTSDRGGNAPSTPTHPRMAAEYPTSTQAPPSMSQGIAGYVDKAREGSRQMLREGEEWVGHEAEELWGGLQSAIRRNPVAAVAMGFGLGCLFSWCMAAWMSSPDDMGRRMGRYSA